MKETMEMIEILNENKKKAQMRDALRAKREKERKQKEKEKEQLFYGIVAVLLFIILIAIFFIGNCYLNNEYNKCIAAGKSEAACEVVRSIDK